ncbi:PQQ-dependent sugar dehydrogenase [Pseudoduganella chitinolytica]|uniref:PQQ-dependent sugar dehydrogenase n=1 Tax=Pseudoduganella chitinolytica TaxID=34070 RepID=A0ABY8BES1_9BURK|nr:PQQ-dependent sugar dehydrogenase [Pseudoduganella chitinolytica]WEF34345.1 PQQ-dependent sugar dehydrogenase [Pseudoduganella chitinolytica]
MVRTGNATRPLLCKTALWTALAAALPAALAQHTRLADPIPAPLAVSPVTVTLRPLLQGLVSPVAAAVAPGEPGNLYVADQIGIVWRTAVGPDAVQKNARTAFLDVRSRLVPLGARDERGLLGLAFHPDYARNGRLYTYTSEPAASPADFSTQPPGVAPNHQSVLTEWRASGGSVDPGSARVLLRIDQPQSNHNAGALAFGPDELLYIALGDGGAGDDQGPGHAAEGNAQSLAPGNVLGKILRIDPLGNNAANGAYGIPATNPFVGRAGADEIYAYGLRNPFRMAFGPDGTLWAGDVGQGAIEEVNHIVAGGNYGWPVKEGSFLFDANGTSPGFVYAASPNVPAGLIDPVAEYDHADGVGAPIARQAVIGGYVYTGASIAALNGQYVFADFIGSTGSGVLLTLGPRNVVQKLPVQRREPLGLAVLGMAQDAAGELYVLASAGGSLTGTGGVVLRVAPGR